MVIEECDSRLISIEARYTHTGNGGTIQRGELWIITMNSSRHVKGNSPRPGCAERQSFDPDHE